MSIQQKPPSEAGSRVGDAKKRPLYRSVSDTLRRRLMEGQMAAGSRLPALRDLASRFNVSTITVRQALRTLEQEGRIHCIPGVGTFVRSDLPRRAASDQITVAFATIEIEVAFTAGIARGIEEACRERGWAMQLFNAQGDPHLEARSLSRLRESGATAAIILPVCDSENLEEMVQLKLARFPCVMIDRMIPGLKLDLVTSDHEKGAYMAVQHLLDHGHRRVLLISEPPTQSSIAARLNGYKKALLDRGIEPIQEWRHWIDQEMVARGGHEQRRWLGGYAAALPALKSVQKPVAVFALNAYSGWGVFKACAELGLKVPDEVSIICFDDAEFTQALTPPMTAVAQRVRELGRTAVETLERRISTGSQLEPQQTILDVDLVERGSVAGPSAQARAGA